MSISSEKYAKLVKQYFAQKFDWNTIEETFNLALRNHISAFESAITCYNTERKNHFEGDYPWIWCINAQEADEIMQSDLPSIETTLTTLIENEYLAKQVFEHLRDNPYFHSVWLLSPKILADNLLLLIYRTTVLFLDKKKLFNEYTNAPKIQLSSTIEEMVFCQNYLGKDTPLFDSFKHWLKDWKEEEFAEELYLALKTKI